MILLHTLFTLLYIFNILFSFNVKFFNLQAELKFDLSRIQDEYIMMDGAPGAGQLELTRRLLKSSNVDALSPRPIEQTRLLLPASGGIDNLHPTQKGSRPKWAGSFLKVMTSSELNQTPKGQSTQELLYRDKKRAITPDSVVLHRRLGMTGTYQVPGILGSPRTRVYNNAASRW